MRRARAKRLPRGEQRLPAATLLLPFALALALKTVTTGRNGSGTRPADAPPLVPDGPPFPIGGPTTSAWREEMITKAQELAGLASWMQEQPDRQEPTGRLVTAIHNELETARITAGGRDTLDGRRLGLWPRLKSSLGGAAFERTLGNLDAAEVNLLRLAPPGYVNGQLPSLQAHVNRYLPKDDPRRQRVDALADEVFGPAPGGIRPTGLATADGPVADEQPAPLGTVEREVLIAAFHAANSQRRRILIRLRSFRNLIVGAAGLLTLLAVGLAVLGATRQDWLPLCFLPESQATFVCPTAVTAVPDAAPVDVDALVAATTTPEDLLLVELIGLVAAAVAGAFSLRAIRGTSTPYGVPLALTILKLPLGALTAVLGLLLIRGEFVPGLSALDSSAQIVAWAILFGYSQQLFTRMVDDRARGLLDDLSGHGAAGDRQPATT